MTAIAAAAKAVNNQSHTRQDVLFNDRMCSMAKMRKYRLGVNFSSCNSSTLPAAKVKIPIVGRRRKDLLCVGTRVGKEVDCLRAHVDQTNSHLESFFAPLKRSPLNSRIRLCTCAINPIPNTVVSHKTIPHTCR